MKKLYCLLPLLLLAGCTWVGSTETLVPTSTINPKPSASPLVLPESSATPTPTSTPRSTASEICRPPGDKVLPEVNIFGDYARAFLDFLNQGGDPMKIEQLLEVKGLGNGDLAYVQADFTGDGRDDLAFSIVNPESEFFPPEGRLLIYVCGLGRYELAHNQTSQSGVEPPRIVKVQDLNADGLVELVIEETSCGAHTCFGTFQVLGWNGAVFVQRLEGVTDDLPSPVFSVFDFDGDGFFQIVITGTGIGSVGAGPQRPVVRTWNYQEGPAAWLPRGDQLGEAEYRIHVLHDADAALQAQDYETALLGYQRVIEDDTLLDWVQPETERANLSAFAYYRIILINSVLGDESMAQEVMEALDDSFPPGSAQRDYVEMAVLFRNAFASGGLQAACNAVKGLAAAHQDTVLEPLGSVSFGYANPDYTLNDLCIPG